MMFEDLVPKTQKVITLRMPKHLWLFFREQATIKETPMNKIINKILISYRKKVEKNIEKDVDMD